MKVTVRSYKAREIVCHIINDLTISVKEVDFVTIANDDSVICFPWKLKFKKSEI